MASTMAMQTDVGTSGSDQAWLARSLRWLAVLAAIAVMAIPDCCLTGRHRVGYGMEAFASICHSR